MRSTLKKIISAAQRRRIRAWLWRVEYVWGPVRGLKAFGFYGRFLQDLRRYRGLEGAERIDPADLWPCLFDKTSDHPVDWQYFYQDSWAARRVLNTRPPEHVDVGSRLDFVGILSAFVRVTFIDIRPLRGCLSGMHTVGGSVLQLPLADGSVRSLSCLHVIEHVGLGRYGDPMDPAGSRKAASELARVLAPGGNLFLGVPVGKERVCYNAHRVHSPRTILSYFDSLDLVEFSCVVGDGRFLERADPLSTDLGCAACGLFWFAKQRRSAMSMAEAERLNESPHR